MGDREFGGPAQPAGLAAAIGEEGRQPRLQRYRFALSFLSTRRAVAFFALAFFTGNPFIVLVAL